jgi:hypothetical protein
VRIPPEKSLNEKKSVTFASRCALGRINLPVRIPFTDVPR